MSKKRRPFLIGLAGGSGSGKTHLARSVAQAVGQDQVAILSMDQYFRTSTREGNRSDINFDHPAHLDFDLMTKHVRQLQRGRTIHAPQYDFRSGNQLAISIEVTPKPIVFVEGLFVLAQPIVNLLDVTVFLDVETDQRLLGRILRDVRERASDVDEIVDRYQRFVRPSYDVFVAPTKQNADVVVDFTFRRILFTKLLTILLTSYLEERLDLESFGRDLGAECDHLGFTPRGGSMPVSIDIHKLARNYPESSSAKSELTLQRSIHE